MEFAGGWAQSEGPERRRVQGQQLPAGGPGSRGQGWVRDSSLRHPGAQGKSNKTRYEPIQL